MAGLLRRSALILAPLALLAIATAAAAEDAPSPGLSERPVLVLDPGVHTATIRGADVDAAGRFVVTASDDKTVRVWSAEDGLLVRTIRLPEGPGNIGKAYAVAISPGGKVIAIGGWTTDVGKILGFAPSDYAKVESARSRATEDEPEQVYLFDAATGEMTGRIEGLTGAVAQLAFSPDGRRLAAVLFHGGLRVYDCAESCREVARDEDYGDAGFGAAFAPDGRLATTCDDGKLRLYDANGTRRLVADAGGGQPFGLAFSPDGTLLAVGIYDRPEVRLFDGESLAPLPAPDTVGFDRGDLATVAWSLDGGTLYAGGQYDDDKGVNVVLAWDWAAAGPPRILPAGTDSVSSLRPLPGGDLLVGAQDPWLGRLAADGTPRWTNKPQQMDPRGQVSSLEISSDGRLVGFGYRYGGERPARFDLSALTLTTLPSPHNQTSRPMQAGLPITQWKGSYSPAFAAERLPLRPGEYSYSLAIASAAQWFVLGTEWYLRAFDAEANPLWVRPAPGVVSAVNISGDGRLAIAAYGDGTIRWHRMEDGAEILAFFPLADETNWVAWTPEGVYAATTGARSVLRWHVNHGWDAAGEAVPVSAIPETFRPDVIKAVLPQLGTAGALAVTELAKIRNAVQVATRAPGARLQVLTIGVDYKLDYAAKDAHDLAETLLTSQTDLYADVLPEILSNNAATRSAIINALGRLQQNMEKGDGRDVAVIAFSGHGALIKGAYFLLPWDVDTTDELTIESSALPVEELQRRLSNLAQHGRVILLLDACHAGAATGNGTKLVTNADRLRDLLRGPNIDVLTSSSGDELSREDKEWGHGAFTAAVLEALTTRADGDGNGVISMNEMAGYIRWRVGQMTKGKQTPNQDLRVGTDVFAAGL